MKILQICSARTIGGGERHVADLAAGLAARGHEVHVAVHWASSLSAAFPTLSQRQIMRLYVRGSLNVFNAFQLAQFIRVQKIEVIHAHVAHDYLVAAFATSLAERGKLVLTRHVLFSLSRSYKRLLRRAVRVIAVSRAVANKLQTDGTFDTCKIVVIHNGVDLVRFTPGIAQFSPQSSNQASARAPYTVGMVGHLAPIKGQEDFIRAAAIVAAKRVDVTFVIAGEDKSRTGENRQRIQDLISSLGLGSRIVLKGWVGDVPSFTSSLDILVSPSRCEPFGLSIIEAMACGVPVIATMSEGACEILENGVTGWLVPLKDSERLAEAIMHLLDDARARQNFSTRAQAVARERFSLDQMVASTEELYKSLNDS